MKKYIFIFLFIFIFTSIFSDPSLSAQIVLFFLGEETFWYDIFDYYNFNTLIFASFITGVLYFLEKPKFNTSTKYVGEKSSRNIHIIGIGAVLIGEIIKQIILSGENACSVEPWMYGTWAVIAIIQMIGMLFIATTDIFFSRWYWFMIDLVIIMILFIWLWMSFFGFMCG